MIAMITSLALTTGSAFAQSSTENFDNTVASVTVEFGRYNLEVVGTENIGYTSATVGAELLTYVLTDSVTSTVGVYAEHLRSAETVGLGLDYTVTYNADAMSLYGVLNAEYVVAEGTIKNGDFFTTPIIGVEYQVSEVFTGFGEVTYSWNMSNDFARNGGSVKLGLDMALADKLTVTPAIVRSFDDSIDTTQAHIGVAFRF